MDSFEWNKIFGALLAIAFVILSVNFLSEGLFHHKPPEKEGFAIEGGTAAHSETAAKPAAKTAESILTLLAGADLEAGQKVAKKCAACHNFAKGAGDKVGPELYNVVERAIASKADFGYSAELKAYGEGKTWSYDELNGFLFKPKTHVKGTSMGFAGLKKTNERANLIAYLRSLAASPAPLPAN